jgi:predicted ATPase
VTEHPLRDSRPVRRVQHNPPTSYDGKRWPYNVPAVAQILREGLDLAAGVTFLVGENGSGKSTLVEAIATAYGLNPEGGSRNARHSTRVSESPLAEVLQLVKSPGAGSWSYFLRAEAMHGLYTYLEKLGGSTDSRYHEMSHGEGFLEVLRHRFDSPGFYLMDEPESALSFRSSLTLLAFLDELRLRGAQVVIATHSPVLCSLPGAQVLEVGEHGIRPAVWRELQLVKDWRGYLEEPQRWLRHLLAEDA